MNRGARKELALVSGLLGLACLSRRRSGWAAAFALGATALRYWPSNYSFRNRSVIITGGSRGLGLALAENLLKAGARVALLARDAEELDRAQAIIEERTGNGGIFTISCDVTQPAELKRALEQAEGLFGRIDILVNNAGVIAIGPFETMDRADFDALIELQVHTVVSASQAILPHFRGGGGGRIVNICSLGGKVAVPHMSSYCAAKFALAGLSSAMAAELAKDNIVVTTVFPGLMRTGSPIQASIKGDHDKEFAWFALGDVTPMLSVSADRAARKILAGIRGGEAEVIFPTTAKLAVFAQTHFPELMALTMQVAARFFPTGLSLERQTGFQSREFLERLPGYTSLKTVAHKAEADYNQQEAEDDEVNLGV